MIKLQQLTKNFGSFAAIQNVSLTINKGEIHGLIGASGAGKSTLLRLMNLLEVPDSGAVFINGQQLTALKNAGLREARKSIGMIFQHFHLVANKTVYANIEIALALANYPKKSRQARVMECLNFVGLEKFAAQYPAQLSGGQKQRVAIARALANEPAVLLCDEPTSALDANTSAEVLRVLEKVNEALGVTIVLVSHELEVINSICHRATVLDAGHIYETVELEPAGIQETNHHPQSFVDQLVKVGDGHA
ncbi:methionine ABC transporter ATP-binding protein [Solibacillus silvestris]|uniref:methionine ABC transporter ATP-binding protein n=1 Tax=Solibacillus silvestris TaxID=76853 RepID=UPI003F7DF4BA